jgi:dihydrofolate synthase/folylpolyglutamate synthase
LDLLKEKGFRLTDSQIRQGLEQVVTNTGLKGRWQILSERPLTICDTAHNVEGIREVVSQLAGQHHQKLYVVLGMVRDKRHDAILTLLPKTAYYVFCQATIPRALDAHDLAARAAQFGLSGVVEPDVNRAIEKAKELAGPDDLIFIGGSTFVVAEINDL